MVCLAESLNICTRLFSFELAIPFTYQVLTKSFLSCIKTVCCAIIVFTLELVELLMKTEIIISSGASSWCARGFK